MEPFDSLRSIFRDLRLALMWTISPVEPETVDGTLENLEGNEYGEYDSAQELRALLGFRDSAYSNDD